MSKISSSRYDRDGDYYDNLRGKVNVGNGELTLNIFPKSQSLTPGVFREVNGHDAELTCEFPRGSHLVSNIEWERVGDRNYSTRSSNLRDSLGRRMEVREREESYGLNCLCFRLRELETSDLF